MNRYFPLADGRDVLERKYADAPNDVPLDSEHRVFLGNSITRRQRAGAFAAIVCIACVYLFRCAQLQIVSGADYRTLAEGNRLRTIALPAKRGLVVDVNGEVLAENVPSFFASIVPEFLPKDGHARADAIVRIADVIGVLPADIEDELLLGGRDLSEPVLIHQELPKEIALKAMVQLRDERAVLITSGVKRSYPQSADAASLSHLLGYEGKLMREEVAAALRNGYLRSDLIGKTGLEAAYEKDLRGTYGMKKVEVDAKGNIERIIASEGRVDGATLKLALDLRLQEAAEQALRDAFKKSGTSRGAVVALDPRNGRIKALVSLPAYDNNLFSGGIKRDVYKLLLDNADRPLYNRAISGEYPSGSTLKIVYAGAALADGIITDATSVLSTGGIHIGEWFFPDWKAGGHGVVNVRKAIAWSVNTFFYVIAGGYDSLRGLGIDKMGEWVRKFGLDQKLGIDIPGERPGFYPTPEWKQETMHEPWYIGDTYHAGIGQGMVLVTPLQVAAYTSVYANGGTLYAPTLAYSLKLPDMPEREVAPRVVRADILPASAVILVRRGMREAVTYGSARSLNDLPFEVAGKTGTAQFQSNKEPHAWFAGFGPYERPELVVAVLVEEGKEGSSNATPVAKAVFRAWYDLQHPTPASPQTP